MIIAAIMVGSFVGTLLATISYFAFGISVLSALMVYLVAALVPAGIATLNVLALMLSNAEQGLTSKIRG